MLGCVRSAGWIRLDGEYFRVGLLHLVAHRFQPGGEGFQLLDG